MEAGEAEGRRLLGAAGGEAADLDGLRSSHGRQEEQDQMSPSALSISSSSSSFSSLASDVESDDDGDSDYPLTQCEYEEIPSFRWIASPLRWWKPKKKTRTKTNHPLRVRNITVALFDDLYPIFAPKDLARAMLKALAAGSGGADGSMHRLTLRDGHQLAMRILSGGHVTAESFEAQCSALGSIRHPNILVLRAYCTWPSQDGGDDHDQKALVFDYMRNGSLSDFVATVSEPADAISMPARMKMAIGITSGLHHLHARCNMVHGNLTSRHVLLDSGEECDGGGGGHGTVKTADHCLIPHLAASVLVSGDDRAAAADGASGYRAPELPALEKPNVMTDVYSLGVIILELLIGRSPKKAMPLWRAPTTLRIALASTWRLAWRCMARSPDARPAALDVLLELQDITSRSLGYGAIIRDIGLIMLTGPNAAKPDRSKVNSSVDGPAGSSPTAATCTTTTITIPATGLDDHKISSPDRAKGATAPKDSQGNHQQQGGQQIPSPTPPSQETDRGQPAAIGERSQAQIEGVAGARPDHITGSPATARLQREEDALDLNESLFDHEGTSDATFEGVMIVDLPSNIDWSKLEAIKVEIQVPSTISPLVNSELDLIYQSYFLTLHKLGNTSPPLPSNVLEGHVNRMIVGLHSMGYPLDEWTKAATLLLVYAKKREYIERSVEEYRAQLEVQAKGFTFAMYLVKEDLPKMQSHLSALEKRNQKLDETIAKFVEYVAWLRLKQEKVLDMMATVRDQLAAAEAKAESLSIDMERVEQRRSATTVLRDEMLQKLPSMDEVFDSDFKEIMAKKY